MGVVTHTYRFSGAGEDFGPRADGMVTLHTWENGPTDNTVAGMMNDLAWQDGDTVPGSYNRVICIDGVISAVPDHHASGAINPSSPAWAPKAWLYTVLDRDEVNNPNYFTLNLCAAGQRGYYDLNGWPPSIVDGFARSIIEEEQRIGRRVVITNHLDFQTNRTDAGLKVTALVKARYAELTGQEPDDMQFWKPVQEDWWTVPGVTFWDGNGTEKSFTTRERVTSVAEATDGHRLVKYGTNELLVMPRTGLVPISGTRIPAAPNYGFPPPLTADCTDEVAAARAAGVTAGKTDMKAKAIVAAENHTTAVRALK
jgi:hypothetical protein